MGDANTRKEFHHLGELIKEGGWIPFETLEIERQLRLVGSIGLTSIVDYFLELEKFEAEGGTISRRQNSITCGFSTNMPVDGNTFFFSNEAIPDHFEQLLGLYQSQKAPFPFLLSQGIFSSYYQRLTAEAKKIWKECSRIKGEILNSELRFKGFDHNRSLSWDALKILYWECERQRFTEVSKVANDMLHTYSALSRIIGGIIKLELGGITQPELGGITKPEVIRTIQP
ncbi:hypothetical protein HYU14_04695 [Candidatus Woesearchaeota archaeon]|nr:hypothetical protein [Candidatus Woesearchaeota archaeon]